MLHLAELSFPALEGTRAFSIAFGSVMAGACLALALPILLWSLPGGPRLFPQAVDRKKILQIAFGVLCISMAFANALCRYIPHRPLGFVHPSFFLTTLALVALLGPRVLEVALRGKAAPVRVPQPVMAVVLVALIGFPITAVVNAFWF